MTDLYFCPRAREIEIHPGGGFTVCCDRPELHIPVANGPMIPATVQLLDAANRADHQAKQRIATLEADGERLARAADDLSRTLAATLERAEQAEAQVARIRAFLEDMAGWCSPHGVAADYAQRGLDALDGLDPLDRIRPKQTEPGSYLAKVSAPLTDQQAETLAADLAAGRVKRRKARILDEPEQERAVLYGFCLTCATPLDFVWRQDGDDRVGTTFCPNCQPQEQP